MEMERLLLAFSLLYLVCCGDAFRSDELQDDEEWGLVGGTSPDSHFIPSPSKISTPTRAAHHHTSPDSRIQFPIDHSFGNTNFTIAGYFTARLKPSPHGGQTLTKVRLTRNPLTESEQKAIEELLKEDDFYRIRMAANVLNPGKDYVLSSLKARCLVKSELEERFIIHMEGVNVIAITYVSTGDCPYPRLLRYPLRWSFNSHMVLKSSEQASRMFTMTEDVLGDETGLGGDEGQKLPEKSFWAKYWMYLVPLGLIIMNAITQAANFAGEQAEGQAPAGSSSSQGVQRISNSGARRR